jgi:hypothetical protein
LKARNTGGTEDGAEGENMFASQEMKRLQQHGKKEQPKQESHYRGSNRRAVAMIPGPALRDTQEISVGDQSKYRQLLLSIEANQSTCCLRITSPKHKSRSAILIFRGRAFGCIYGSKRFGQQLFGEQAYQHILADMSHRDNVLDAYILSEDIVLAAASLFHGEIFSARSGASSEEVFEAAHNCLTRAGKPGCIVINDQDKLPVAVVYVFGGKVVGVFSHKDGWVSTNYQTALKYVTQNRNASVFASMLSASNTQEVLALTFSLSGLGDRESSQWNGISKFELGNPIFVNMQSKMTKSNLAVELNKFVPGISNPAAHLNRSLALRNAFRVDP